MPPRQGTNTQPRTRPRSFSTSACPKCNLSTPAADPASDPGVRAMKRSARCGTPEIAMSMEPDALARQIAAKLKSAGYQAYFVGGCVRDLLLGIQPRDYDIATDARPDEIVTLFPRSNLVGAHFGVVVVEEGGARVEVAT